MLLRRTLQRGAECFPVRSTTRQCYTTMGPQSNQNPREQWSELPGGLHGAHHSIAPVPQTPHCCFSPCKQKPLRESSSLLSWQSPSRACGCSWRHAGSPVRRARSWAKPPPPSLFTPSTPPNPRVQLPSLPLTLRRLPQGPAPGHHRHFLAITHPGFPSSPWHSHSSSLASWIRDSEAEF